MQNNKVWSFISYLIYLILIAIGLVFLFHYSGVPEWVWTFFIIAIILLAFALVLKDFVFKDDSSNIWNIVYIILYFSMLILLIIGLALVIKDSSIRWWAWTIFLIGFVLLMASGVILNMSPQGEYMYSLILAILALIILFIGIILILAYSHSKWWVWLIFIFAIIFFIIGKYLEHCDIHDELKIFNPQFRKINKNKQQEQEQTSDIELKDLNQQ